MCKELKEKHGNTFDTPKLRLWARMVCSNLHEDLDNPHNIPAFNGSIAKKPRRQESLSDALCTAAISFANAFSSRPPKQSIIESQQPATCSLPAGISPSKSVDLRMMNFQQLYPSMLPHVCEWPGHSSSQQTCRWKCARELMYYS